MFKHYIFTRFNRSNDNMTIYNNPQIKDPEDWMDHRMKLFNEITLPSVMLQGGKFTWLLSFAEETPKYITDYYSEWPNVKIIYQYPRTWIQDKVKDGEWIITSRLDNDDYIYPDYIQKVQGMFDEKFLLVDTDGRKRDLATGKIYTVERKTCNSPFISLIEQVNVPYTSASLDDEERWNFAKNRAKNRVLTCYYCSHSKMEWHFPAVKINEVLYHMILHDKNISNKLEGNEHEIL